MTAKVTISLTDQAHEFAEGLVARGDFASLSAVLQHALRLLQRDEEEHRARIEAIRADLDERAATPPISMEEMDARLAAWRRERDQKRAKRKDADTDDLA